jgi:hypothetical protein
MARAFSGTIGVGFKLTEREKIFGGRQIPPVSKGLSTSLYPLWCKLNCPLF